MRLFNNKKLVLLLSIFTLISLCLSTFVSANYSENITIDGIKDEDYELSAENNNFHIHYANSETKHFLFIESLTYNFSVDNISIGFGVIKMDISDMKSKTSFYTMFRNDTILEISIIFSFTDFVSTVFYIEVNGQKQVSAILSPKLPPQNPKIVINNGESKTNQSLVNLTLSAIGADEMCFRNGTNGEWTDWETYTTTKQLYLSEIKENKKNTIYVKFRNENNESKTGSDSIIYSTISPEEEVKPYFGIADVLESFGRFLVENPVWLFVLNFCAFLIFTKIYFFWHFPIIYFTNAETGKSEEIGRTGIIQNFNYWILFRLLSFLSQSRRCSMWLRDKVLKFVEVKDENGVPEMIKEIEVIQPRYCEDKIITLVDVQYQKWEITEKGKNKGTIIKENGIPLYQVKKLENNDLVVKNSVKRLKKYDGLEKIENIAESIKYQHSINEMIAIQDLKQSKSEMRIKGLSEENFGLREALIQKENEFRKSLADTISQIEKRARADNIDIAKLIEGIVAGKMSSADIRSTIKKEYRDFLEVRSSGEVNNLKIQLASAIRHIEFIEGKLKQSNMKKLPLKTEVSEDLVEDNLLEE